MRWHWILFVGLAWPLSASAQTEATRAAARTLGTEGVEALQAGHYAEAVDKLDRAFTVVRAPSIGLWLARALVKSGKWVEATERYLEVSRLDPSSGDVGVQRQAQADAAKELEQLSARLPALRIQVRGASPNATVTIDAKRLPDALLGAKVPVNPGAHVVELHDGYQHSERRVDVREAGTVAVSFDANAAGNRRDSSTASTVSPVAKPGLSKLQVTGIVVGGVGALGLGLSGYFAIRARSFDRESKQAGRCDEQNTCDATGYAQRGDAIDHATAATVSVLAGSVLAGLGLTLVLAGGDKRQADTARVEARPIAAAGLGGLELCGRF